MTKQKDKKRHFRDEAKRTGKSYVTVRAENESRTATNKDAAYAGLELWCRCVQAVGWWMFTKGTYDSFEYAESVSGYAESTTAEFIKYERIAPSVVARIDAFVVAAGRAAQKLDAAACLLNLERADVLLTQSGWSPLRATIEDLRSLDYDEVVDERLGDRPIPVKCGLGEASRVLSLSKNSLYRVRGTRPHSPAAGKVCRLLLFNHYVPGEAVVEYVDNHRNAVFDLADLEEVVDPSRLPRCSRCGTPLEQRIVQQRVEMEEDDLDSLTDGQRADYFGELENPDLGDNWLQDGLIEMCPKCDAPRAADETR